MLIWGKIIIGYLIIGILFSFVIIPGFSRLTGYKEGWYNFEQEEDNRLFFAWIFLWPLMLLMGIAWIFYEVIPKMIADYVWKKRRRDRK